MIIFVIFCKSDCCNVHKFLSFIDANRNKNTHSSLQSIFLKILKKFILVTLFGVLTDIYKSLRKDEREYSSLINLYNLSLV